MADNRVRLIHEIDGSPSLATAQQIERRYDRAHDSIDKGAQKAARTLASAARAMSAGIGAITSAAAASERQWISLGTSILASFAAGGPIAGAISVVAAGVGLLVGQLKKAGDEGEASFRRIAAATRETSSALDDARQRLFILGGGSSVGFQIKALESRLVALQGGLGEVFVDEGKRQEMVTAIKRQIEDLRAIEAINRKIAEEEEARWIELRKVNLELERGFALRKAGADFWEQRRKAQEGAPLPGGGRTRMEIAEELARRGFTHGPASVGTGTLVGAWDPKVVSAGVVESTTRVVPTLASDFDAWRRTFGPQLSGTFADAITDGAMTGFENLEDIGRNALGSLLAQTTNLLITAGLRSVAGGLFPVARGAAFAGGRVMPFARGGVVDRPTLFPMANGAGLMGEAGPEAVLPLRRGRGGRLGVESGGGGTTIRFGDIHLARDFSDLPEDQQARLITRGVMAALRSNRMLRAAVQRGAV